MSKSLAFHFIQRFKDITPKEKLFKRGVYKHNINENKKKITLVYAVSRERTRHHFLFYKRAQEQESNSYNRENAAPKRKRAFYISAVAFEREKLFEASLFREPQIQKRKKAERKNLEYRRQRVIIEW